MRKVDESLYTIGFYGDFLLNLYLSIIKQICTKPVDNLSLEFMNRVSCI